MWKDISIRGYTGENEHRVENPKSQARNPKQIQMTEIRNPKQTFLLKRKVYQRNNYFFLLAQVFFL
jgi:hypothetical protein